MTAAASTTRSAEPSALRALVDRSSSRNLSLDGLRGVAILLVVASHASAGRVPYGGMVGVTLFFVLSGYLITSILVREYQKHGSVSFGNFYARRALRLLPALALMLIVAPAYLWLVQEPGFGPELIPASIVALFYLSNFFRAAGDPLVVYGHTWSLSVEEQFYLIWPAILVFLIISRLRRWSWFWVVLTIGVVLAAWRVVVAVTQPFDRAYFSLDTNAFALMFGAALAMRPVRLSRSLGILTTLIALLGLGALSVLPGTSAQYYDVLALGAPVAGALAVIAVVGATNANLLAWTPLVFFGRISYGLYLWHEVFLLSHPFGEPLTDVWRLVAVISAIALALASWVWVEHPFLVRKRKYETGARLSEGRPAPAG